MQVTDARPEHRDALRALCRKTSRSRPIAPVAEDPELAPRLHLDAYLELEPRACLVALEGDRVVGYVVGTARTTEFRLRAARWHRRRLPSLLAHCAGGLFRGRYRSAAGRRALLRTLVGMARGRYGLGSGHDERADPAVYSAHCHLQVDPDQSNPRVGLALLTAHRARLRELGATGQVAAVIEREGAEGYSRLVRALGFEELSCRRVTRAELPTLLDDGVWLDRVLVRRF